jgi:hypothetical protein
MSGEPTESPQPRRMRPLLSKRVRALLDELGDRGCIPAVCAV